MTVAPRSTAVCEARAPSILPWAVRAAPTMTISDGEGVRFCVVMVFVVPFVRGHLGADPDCAVQTLLL